MSIPTPVPGQGLASAGSAGRSSKGLGARIWDARWCYALMVPGLVLIGMFSAYPMVMSWYYSFYDWSGIGNTKYYIGLQNYRQIIHDHFFWSAFSRSFWFMVVATPIELIVSLLIAVLLNDKALKLGPIFRTLIFIPVVTTTAIVSIVMSFVFAAYDGPINMALQKLGLINHPIDYLGNPHSVMWTAIGIFCWKWLGQPMIYWLAGLQTIPQEIYEAARVDGASSWRQLTSITAPLMTPFAIVITLITAVGNLQVFAFLQALTNGGPFYSTETMELYIYRTAFGAAGSASQPRLGYASAAGIIFGVVVMIIAAVQILALRRWRSDASGLGRSA
ncbi:MAG: carbohydrate ABC transporter permease [Mycobacteriales bacterium]